jgi:hypothetical protein
MVVQLIQEVQVDHIIDDILFQPTGWAIWSHRLGSVYDVSDFDLAGHPTLVGLLEPVLSVRLGCSIMMRCIGSSKFEQ